MPPESWRRLNDLFHEALERAPAVRKAFLDEVCGGDASVQAEVLSLLAAHEKAGVLDRPAYEAGAGLLLEGDEGDEMQAADGALVGRHLGPYRVISILGRGGMGVVYLGEDTRLVRPVAIKTLPSRFTDDDGFRERLRREAITAGSLSHPGIATVYALEEIEGRLYLVREYVAGQTLREILAAGQLPLEEVSAIGVAVAQALVAAHARGVIHRDLKPENVMRTADAAIKVLDFGLARVGRSDAEGSRERLTRGGAALGTPGYMSPEQLRGGAVDFRTDHFSFGVLLYELTTGRHPFEGADSVATIARVLEADPEAAATLRPACPPALERILRVCLSKTPTERYPTTKELVADLEAVASGEVAPAGRTAASGRSPARRPPVTARWWWQFHQLALSVGYIGLVVPLWLVRGWAPGGLGLAGFVAAVAVVGASVNLRLHWWFSSRFYPDELEVQLSRGTRWARHADTALAVLCLAAAAVAVGADHGEAAAGFVAVAVTLVMLSRLVEPVTSRAAFRVAGSRGNES